MSTRTLIDIPWIVFIAYWIISALNTKRTQKREPFLARYGVMLIEVVGFVFLFDQSAGMGILGQRVLNKNHAIQAAAIALTWAGVLLAVWARRHLGQYWSGRITIKEGHKLIRTGPYARLRHPIYSGLDLAAIGTAFAIDRWRCVVGFCVIIGGFWIKAKREEAMLTAQFGSDFQEHRRQTGFLFPRLRSYSKVS
jgi:protein-S-isoprenylcysteine O-methyltransferase Ste14